ncbi:hypothetical protein [Noviherbaspirillum sp.]|uniref:hypothetical protein n=1 Tax=Noviherbaspirillum sp. TaxID=1926288 RepID=UPI0025D407BD|nr:hypothetical protein [Noviherbaspirillum sp.]
MAKSDHKKGALPYQFAALPMDVIRSGTWQALPHSARALAIDLMSQYTGKNNGRLCPAFVVMERYGWASKRTLIDAKRALIECPFVVLTRKGHPPRTSEWLAFTWWRLDYEKSMDIDPKAFPYLNFVHAIRPDPNTGRVRVGHDGRAQREVQKLYRYDEKTALQGAETALQKAIA